MVEHCHNCGIEIHPFLTGKKYIDGIVHCSDCYFDEAGECFEKYPIGIELYKKSEE